MCNLSENIYEKGIEKGEEKLLRQIIQSKIRNNASDDDIYNEFMEFGASMELIEKIRTETSNLPAPFFGWGIGWRIRYKKQFKPFECLKNFPRRIKARR